MNALTSFHNSRPLSVNKNATTYRGPGYLYHMRKSAHDVIAKLKISRELLARFVKNCGTINTVQLPGLTVAEQGGGWYEIFVLMEQRCPNVIQFIKRLNQWMHRQNFVGPKLPRSLHYVLEVRVFDHAPRLGNTVSREAVKPKPVVPNYLHGAPVAASVAPVASLTRLQQLAQTVNARFGH